MHKVFQGVRFEKARDISYIIGQFVDVAWSDTYRYIYSSAKRMELLVE